KRAYCLKIQPATGSFARNLIYSTKPREIAYSAAFPTLTRLRGLAPRHLRAAILSFLVHAQQHAQTASHIGLQRIEYIKNIC
ncbi:hypothetical protein, partial [Klebsiella sp. 96093]|uniref:hypothetical protein n=1 Tax=Klebsiella sp. 96093 TaxID=3079154 RepID=UPI003007E6FE